MSKISQGIVIGVYQSIDILFSNLTRHIATITYPIFQMQSTGFSCGHQFRKHTVGPNVIDIHDYSRGMSVTPKELRIAQLYTIFVRHHYIIIMSPSHVLLVDIIVMS